jgi:hypothetical protein
MNKAYSLVTSRSFIPSSLSVPHKRSLIVCPWTYAAFTRAFQSRDFDKMKTMKDDGLQLNTSLITHLSSENGDHEMLDFFTEN